MKKLSIITISVLALVFASGALYSAPVFYSWGGEKIIKVKDLPDTPDFRTRSGKYVDAGYLYKQITVFFVPVWNYGGKWVGYTGSDKSYLRLKENKLRAIAKKAKIELPKSPTLPFWDAIGGKLVILALFVLAFGIYKMNN